MKSRSSSRAPFGAPTKRSPPLNWSFSASSFTRYSQHLAQLGRFDDAVKALDESSDAGFDPYFLITLDEKMEALRKSPQYQAALKLHDAARLAAAKERVGSRLAKPADVKFAFTLNDVDNKPVSLSDFKGKVVLVDFWGTWCGPCRQTIPGLIALYENRKAKGLEVIGIDYERDIKEPAKIRENLASFIKATKMPYRNVIGDEATIQQIPDFKGFPTTVIVDRAGQVRAMILENDTTTPELIRDIVEVLLDEPAPPAVKEPRQEGEVVGQASAWRPGVVNHPATIVAAASLRICRSAG